MNRRQILIAALPAAVLSVIQAQFARADLPLIAGNFQIAQEFLHGDAHVMVVGDSEQNLLLGQYPTTWQVDRWSGIVGGDQISSTGNGDVGTYIFGFTAPYIASENEDLANTTDPVAQGAAPDDTNAIVFHQQTAPSSDGNLLANRVFDVTLEPNQSGIFHGGVWDNSPTGTLHADAIVYANPNGVSSGVELDMRGSSNTTPLASAIVNTQSSTTGLIDIPLSFSSQNLNSSGVSASFRMIDNAAAPEGSNLVLAGVRFSNGQPGFQLANIAQGGEGVNYFLNSANQHLDQFVQMTDTNLAYIWIGQNDTSVYTPDQYKQKIETLIADYKQTNPNMKFVLVAPYDTGNATLAGYAQDFYDISQADSSVLFLNMYEAAGSFSTLDANYLVDHIHPNAAGAVYFANLSQTLLADADSMAIKLPGDATLDGTVDASDFDMLASHYGDTNAYLAIGDFNGDGTINALDFNVLATNYGKTLSDFEPQPAGTVVPEPAAGIILLPLLLAAVASRRTRFGAKHVVDDHAALR